MVYIPSSPETPAPPVATPDDRSAELWINRLNTKAFIEADPISLSLTRSGSVRTPGGGIKRQGAAQTPLQTFKLIMQSPAGGSIEQRTEDGTERRVEYVLLGEWDADVQTGDFWNDERGQRWEVTAIIPRNGYELRAVVEAHGDALTGG